MDITLNIWSILFLFTAFQGLLLSALLLSDSAKRHYLPNRLIASVVLTFTSLLGINVAFWNELHFSQTFIHLHQIYWPFIFLIGPLMYVYLQIQIAPFSKRAFRHFILPLLVLLVWLPFYGMKGEAKVAFYQEGFHLLPQHRLLVLSMILGSIGQIGAYAFLNFRLVKAFSRSNTPFPPDEEVLAWMKKLTRIFALYALLYTSYYILIDWLGLSVTWDYLLSLAMAGCIYVIGIKAFLQPALFKERAQLELIQQKKPKELFSPEAALAYQKRLVQLMEEKRPYLNDQLKLPELAEMIDLSPHQLSYLLNRYMHSNFSHFTNGYRVAAAKKMLLNPEKKHLKIIAIGYETGFNSQTAFYRTFKKYTGKTPAAYRKEG